MDNCWDVKITSQVEHKQGALPELLVNPLQIELGNGSFLITGIAVSSLSSSPPSATMKAKKRLQMQHTDWPNYECNRKKHSIIDLKKV